LQCDTCVNQCQIPDGERGFCSLKRNKGGKFNGEKFKEGNLIWYYTKLPGNCSADRVCPEYTEGSYPESADKETIEQDNKCLAVFFNSCTFNCLFCRNWHFRTESLRPDRSTDVELIKAIDDKVRCICFAGGDPTPQLPFALKVSERILKEKQDRVIRICWETNGSMNTGLLQDMAMLSFKSGGCIKFEIKAYTDELNIALCGVTNKQTLINFEYLAKFVSLRPEPPIVIASTLLIPGYIDEEEISKIAKFIASINPYIPYNLLAFDPQFYFWDLPTTSHKHALRCQLAAYESGLKEVKIGNIHLLGEAY
jgi:pyruvate formate lyase activating enzyme